MEDNDERKSSVPSAASVSSGEGADSDSKQDLFDPHEQTLPRFTIDPGEAVPLRQRTRTLLGVPTLVTDDATPTSAPLASSPSTETSVASGRLTASLQEVDESLPTSQLARPAQHEQDHQGEHDAVDMTIDVVEDELNDVTMVSDADVFALPDNTGQLQPVRFDAEPPASVVSAAAASKSESTRSESAYAATAPNQSSLAPREITRAAAAPPSNHEAASGRWGALLVAAVMLLATGAWFLTAGTFRRATLSSAPSESTTAAATQPANTLAADKAAQVAPPAQAPIETPAPSTASTESSAPATPAPVTTAHAAATDDGVAPGPGLKNKPALTASVRGERVRRSSRAGKANVAPAPVGEMPQGPTRADVVSRLESVRPAVHACAAGRSGVADLDVTIAHTGVVTHVLVGGDFAGTTEGSCIARAVRQARFPAFKQERFRLLYPYAM